jgi:cyclic-di-GMP-binding biofilm dispersal mediator protein
VPGRDLGGASVLVAGASGGLGRHLVGALLTRGAAVTAFARDGDRLLSRVPDSAHRVLGDVRDAASCAAVVRSAVDHGGGLDAVVHAAGVVAFGPLVELDDAVLDDVVTTNLLGPLRLTKAALPHLRPGGIVVHLSGAVADVPTAGMVAYSAAKGGLRAADVALARELRRARIDVLDARPPHTDTGLADRALSGEPPRLGDGLEPAAVAERIVAAMEAGDRDLPPEAFTA